MTSLQTLVDKRQFAAAMRMARSGDSVEAPDEDAAIALQVACRRNGRKGSRRSNGDGTYHVRVMGQYDMPPPMITRKRLMENAPLRWEGDVLFAGDLPVVRIMHMPNAGDISRFYVVNMVDALRTGYEKREDAEAAAERYVTDSLFP